ncbi:MAG: polysaccharide pyruvyl transferase family protein [Microbacteriaceae bacterium]
MTGGSDYDVRARLALGQTLQWQKSPRFLSSAGNLVPSRLASPFGLVRERDVTGVVDAAGYAYGDPFGAGPAVREARFSRSWSKRGTPRVMLPQAFGPFEDQRVRAATRELLNSSQLVFVRDQLSANYVSNLNVSTTIQLSPDFTIGLAAHETERAAGDSYGVVVPNAKMYSTGLISEAEYASLLRRALDALVSQGLLPVVLVHESGDLPFARSLVAGTNVSLVWDPDPRGAKSKIGKADFVISSRFHALVGALSQGVPTIALGWSHKYKELLRDFGVPDWCGDVNTDVASAISEVLNDSVGLKRLIESGRSLLSQNDAMWAETRQVLGLPSTPV